MFFPYCYYFEHSLHDHLNLIVRPSRRTVAEVFSVNNLILLLKSRIEIISFLLGSERRDK